MAKRIVQLSIDPKVIETFDDIVGQRNRSSKIQELIEEFNNKEPEKLKSEE